MEIETANLPGCPGCSAIQSIVRSNQQMIQEQVRLIKNLHLENLQVKEKYINLQSLYKSLQAKYQQQLCRLKQKNSQQTQTQNTPGTSLSSIEQNNVQPQQLKLSTKINAQIKEEQSKRKQKEINKQNLQKVLPIVTMRKNDQYFSRKRKNSFQEDHYTASWLKIIESFPSLSSQKFRQKTIGLIKKMVPHQIRHIVWPIVSKNTLAITDELYCELIQRKDMGWVSKDIKTQIDKDVNRSFVGRCHFQQKEGLKIEVTEVLELFHLYRPDVSYIQGMTYPVIVLTLIVGKLKAFRIFANIILSNSFFRRLYTFQPKFVLTASRTFQLLLFDYSPDIAQRFAQLKIDPQIFLVEWFYTIFSRSLSFEGTLKFWDHLMYHGEVVMYRLALSIIETIKLHMMETNYQETVGLIQGFGSYIREDKLFDLVANHKLSNDKLEKTFEKIEKLIVLHQEE